MIDVAGLLAVGTLLLVLLVVVWRRSAAATYEFPPRLGFPGDSIELRAAPCPPDIVSRIFSNQDRDFVSGMRSEALMRFFCWERKAVALLWIRETSAGIKEIIQEHAALARSSQNLEFRKELSIFLQYIHLRLICSLLFFLVVLAGPPFVHGLALYVDGLFLRFGQAQAAMKMAMEPRELDKVRAA